MRLLVDTNVILDIFLEREPFYTTAINFLAETNEADIDLAITATTVSDLYYITRKAKDHETALRMIADLLGFVDVATVDKSVIMHALESGLRDFEDAIQTSSANQSGITTIITRNQSDFSGSGLEVYSPDAFLDRLNR